MAHDHDHHDHDHDHDHDHAFDMDGITVETEETSPVVRTLTITVDASRVGKAFDRVYA